MTKGSKRRLLKAPKIEPKTRTWHELDAMRQLEKIPISAVCKVIQISPAAYGHYMVKPKKATPKDLANFETFLNVHTRNMGVNNLIYIRNLLWKKGQDESAFWRLMGKSVFQVRNQIANKRSISFDQIVQAYGCLGYEVVIKDLYSDTEVRTYCDELETYKQLHARHKASRVD